MIKDVVIHFDSTTNPLKVYEMKLFLKKNNIDYRDAFYRNIENAKSFFNGLNSVYFQYLSENNLSLKFPFDDIILTCSKNGEFVIKQGSDSIKFFLLN